MQITFEVETPHYRFRVETGRMEDVLHVMDCVRRREDADVEGDPDASPMGWDKDDAAAAAALEGEDYNPDEEEVERDAIVQGDTVIVPEQPAHPDASMAKQQAAFAQAAAITPDEIMSKVSRVAMDAYGRNKAGMKALLAEYNVTKFVELNGNVPVLLEFGAKAERL